MAQYTLLAIQKATFLLFKTGYKLLVFLEKIHEASNNVLIYFDWCFLKHPKNVIANFLGRRIENRMNFLGYSNLFGESPV